MARFPALAVLTAAALLTGGCKQRVELLALRAGGDLTGVTSGMLHAGEGMAAIEVTIPADAARGIARWGNSNVVLRLHRCGQAGEGGYPASAWYRGAPFEPRAVAPAPGEAKAITLTFFLPQQIQARERYDCAQFDARGMTSPFFFMSEPQRLPPLRFVPLRRGTGLERDFRRDQSQPAG